MKRTLLFWAAGFLLIAIGWRVVEACSCAYQHPQTQYCDADFVLLVVPKYINQVDNGTSTQYIVKFKKTFKANSAARYALRKRKIYTGNTSCGVVLNTTLTYLVSGNIINGRPEINLCGLNSLWSDVPCEKRDQLKRFKYSCCCTVDTCDGTTSCNKTENSCVYNNTFANSFDCYSNYGVCTKNKCGECDWVRSRHRTRYSALAECLNTTIAYI